MVPFLQSADSAQLCWLAASSFDRSSVLVILIVFPHSLAWCIFTVLRVLRIGAVRVAILKTILNSIMHDAAP
ncbi:hypothetical protein ARMSODRAFT_955961 [Armillaria solidipes]|uniref:Uncharacterized protein n=1 Tax=Armillaria solidipes TaxID=1076256 RepID=A0A2H3C2U9_9AGAR|nr:hypothetical protein ARMSODRAFT_955961 [Armillaria solidipes]